MYAYVCICICVILYIYVLYLGLGLIECPQTTRVEAVMDSGYTLYIGSEVSDSTCEAMVSNSATCMTAAQELFDPNIHTFNLTTLTNDPTHISGCSVAANPSDPRNIQVLFNSDTSRDIPCGVGINSTSGKTSGIAHDDSTKVTVQVDLDATNDLVTLSLSGPSDVWFGVGFGAQKMKDAPWAVIIPIGLITLIPPLPLTYCCVLTILIIITLITRITP